MAVDESRSSLGDLTRLVAAQPRWERRMSESPDSGCATDGEVEAGPRGGPIPTSHHSEDTAPRPRPAVPTDRSTSTAKTAWNIANAVQGVSVLSLPYAVGRGGWVALGAFLAVGLMSNMTGKFLIDCLYDKPLPPIFPFLARRPRRRTSSSRRVVSIQAQPDDSYSASTSESRPLLGPQSDDDDAPPVLVRKTYAEIGQACWSLGGYPLVLVIQCVELLGVCSLSLYLMGQAIEKLTEQWIQLPLDTWMSIMALAVLPTVFLPRLSQLSWLSLVGILTIVILTATVLANSISRYSNWHSIHFDTPSWSQFPVAIGIIVFGYAAHGQFPSFHIRMEKPMSFGRAIDIAFLMVTFIDLAIAILGFLAYGHGANDIISQSMPGAWSAVINILLLINLMLSYALPMFPVSALMDTFLQKYFPLCGSGGSGGLQAFYHLTTRMFLVGLTLLIAVSVPNFHLLMSFIGSITCVMLVFVLPCTFHLILHHRHLSMFAMALDVLLVLISTTAGVAGIYASYVELSSS